MPDLEAEVVDDRLDVLGAQVRRGAQDVARVRLLDRQSADRPALGVVGVHKRRPGLAAQHVGDLPRQVERVLHPGVPTEAAVGRHCVRGVAGE